MELDVLVWSQQACHLADFSPHPSVLVLTQGVARTSPAPPPADQWAGLEPWLCVLVVSLPLSRRHCAAVGQTCQVSSSI